MNSGKWDARIHRAAELASVYPFASEGLRFYTRIANFQRSLRPEIGPALTNSPTLSSARPLRDELSAFLLLTNFPGFLSVIQQNAPVPLARAAAALAQKGPSGWQQAIEDFWGGDSQFATPVNDPGEVRSGDSQHASSFDQFLAWIYLQPYAEYLAERWEPIIVERTPVTCPLCGARPIVGVLRPEGDGAKKSLICMLCGHEWLFRRVYCPACGEQREAQMAFYSAPEIPHVRVDVCDTCHSYLKSIDLTKMGLAVPIVDELATIPLDLWAREHGYEKLQTNLLGT